ncbi:DUF2726 domain-containing protein [Psychromonas sp.]|nr:DUF2726 domain-containing protein [Psychromonas sp.]
MIFVILTVIILILFFIFKLKLQSKDRSNERFEYSYQRLTSLFTPAERSFYGVLNQAINGDLEVFAKVRVADVLTPKKSGVKGTWQTAFNKISAKHFDFVICNKNDLSFACAIELDDSSHNTAKAKKRDAFLESACQSANFPLMRVPAKATYNIDEIIDLLKAYLPEIKVENHIKKIEVPMEVKANRKLCLKCSSEMNLKMAKKGKNSGNEFWACSAFPGCNYTEEK